MYSTLLVFDAFEPASNYIKSLIFKVLKEIVVNKIVLFHHVDNFSDPIFSPSEKLVLIGAILHEISGVPCIIDGDSFEKNKNSLYQKILSYRKKYPIDNLFLLLDSKKLMTIKESKDFVLIKSISKIVLYLFPEDIDMLEEKEITSNEIIFINSDPAVNELSKASIYNPSRDSYPDLVIDYMNKSSECAIKRIKKELSETRVKHSLRVAGMVKYILDLLEFSNHEISYNIYLAALYHDICKEMDVEEQIRIANNICRIKAYPNVKVLHGYVGAWFLKDRYFFDNEEILEAIREHTIPSNNPSLITKILYLADHLEPLKKDKYSQEEYDSWFNLIKNKDIDKAFEEVRWWMKQKHADDTLIFDH